MSMSIGMGLRLGGRLAPLDGVNAVLAASSAWLDGRDIVTGAEQVIASRTGSASFQMGTTTGVDVNDPTLNNTLKRVEFGPTNNLIQLDAALTPAIQPGSGQGTFLFRIETTPLPERDGRFYSTESTPGHGILLGYGAAGDRSFKARIRDGTSQAIATLPAPATAGDDIYVAAIFDNGTLTAWSLADGMSAGSDYSGLSALTHIAPRLGMTASSITSTVSHNLHAFAYWTTALTASQLEEAASGL